jgi:hypothetical protein
MSENEPGMGSMRIEDGRCSVVGCSRGRRCGSTPCLATSGLPRVLHMQVLVIILQRQTPTFNAIPDRIFEYSKKKRGFLAGWTFSGAPRIGKFPQI